MAEFDLNIDGLDNIRNMFSDLVSEEKIELAMDDIVKEGEREAQENLLFNMDFYLIPTYLYEDIHWTQTGKYERQLTADAGCATFVEFGTGIVGLQEPHPEADDNGWKYDVKGHGRKGWWYPVDYSYYINHSTVQPYRKKSDGNYIFWTRGQPSRPFMWSAKEYMKNNAESILLRAIVGINEI